MTSNMTRRLGEYNAEAGMIEPRTDWQPIETAPRDGTKIRVYSPAAGRYIAVYREGEWLMVIWAGLLSLHGWQARPLYWQPLTHMQESE